jgi:hypothetical protein
MQNLGIIGLTLDLVGVVILGFDLVRVQVGLRSAAKQRLDEWETLLAENESLDSDLEKLKFAGHWQETDYDEGRVRFLDGTFDARAASNAFADLAGTNREQGRLLAILAENLKSSALSDVKAAQISLFSTYVGMLLIVIGFALQIGGQFGF